MLNKIHFIIIIYLLYVRNPYKKDNNNGEVYFINKLLKILNRVLTQIELKT